MNAEPKSNGTDSRTKGRALKTALSLLKASFWPIAIYPAGIELDGRVTSGKEPIGKKWGLEPWTGDKLRATFDRYPNAGVGILFGPGRAPGGGWLIDLEGDGPAAEESKAKLLGGEIPDSPAWSSRRGSHQIFVADGERLLTLLASAGAKEGRGAKVGVWHLAELPDLEIRVGGFKPDGTVKQVQSVVPPTPGADGKPRAWIVAPRADVAEIPAAAYAFLESIIPSGNGHAPEAPAAAPNPKRRRDRVEAYVGKALKSECDAVEAAAEGNRNNRLNAAAYSLGQLIGAHHLDRGEAVRALLASANRAGLGDGESQRTIQSGIDAGILTPRDLVNLGRGGGPPSGNGNGHPPSDDGHHEDDPKKDAEKQTQILMRLTADVTLFRDPDKRAFASVLVDGHREVHAVRSQAFSLWLRYRFYTEVGRPPSAQALADAILSIEAHALFKSPEETVHVRVAGEGDSIFIDLGEGGWRVIEITPKGWSLKTDATIRFRRPAGLRPIPMPKRGGSIDELRRFVNCDDEDFVIIVAWLAAALRPEGPYPVLVVTGEQGAAKSTLARGLRKLIDPHSSLIRAEPKDPRDLVISAVNGWVFALDNLGSIVPWLSDALCRLASGGGFATRKLYTEDEETYLDAQRPAILTGITDFVSRPDLADRCIFIHLPAISDAQRRTEQDFWEDFTAATPSIVGALFELVSQAMRILPDVKLESLPRMADFMIFGEAISRAMGKKPGDFASAFLDNRAMSDTTAVDDSPVASAIRELAERRGTWQGTAAQLMTELASIVSERATQQRGWPQTPRSMSAAVGTWAPKLRRLKVKAERGRKHDRIITIEKIRD